MIYRPCSLTAARDLVIAAERLVVLSGAGLSAESGISTFRGAGGHWREHRATDLATPGAFERDPALVWEWYSERRRAALDAEPNPAHHALASFQARRGRDRVALVTQTVDGLLQRAGAPEVLELHGSLFRVRCSCDCGGERYDERTPWPHPVPCAACGSPLRPAVVWFGEELPEPVFARSCDLAASADVVLVVGTSAVVYPAAGLATMGAEGGAAVIEVNLEPTPLSPLVHASLLGSAGEIVPILLAP